MVVMATCFRTVWSSIEYADMSFPNPDCFMPRWGHIAHDRDVVVDSDGSGSHSAVRTHRSGDVRVHTDAARHSPCRCPKQFVARSSAQVSVDELRRCCPGDLRVGRDRNGDLIKSV